MDNRVSSSMWRWGVAVGAVLFVLAIGAWASYFRKVTIFDSVRIVKIQKRDGAVSVWYFHPPVSWLDGDIGVDLQSGASVKRLRFVVSKRPWPFARPDKVVGENVVYDKSVEAFHVIIPLDTERERLLAVSRSGGEVVLWPCDDCIPPGGVYCGDLLIRQELERKRAAERHGKLKGK